MTGAPRPTRTPARLRRLGFGAFGAVVAASLGWLAFVDAMADRDAVDRLGFIKERVRAQFPAAPQLSTSDFHRRLEAGERFVVLDVRTADEFAVSHLPGAIRVDPSSPPALPAAVADLANDTTVVAYCAVGWRSSKWVEGLRRQGVDAVNLEGSIFQWIAEDRPVERGGRPVTVVHPYSQPWAWLVDPEHRAFEPARP
ncbi:MAG: rhodanese-like domain-containing protein [Acidobacteriota bacterium]